MGDTPRTHTLLPTHRPYRITPYQTILQLRYQVSVDSTLYFTFVMFHVKRCAFPAFPQQIIKSCDVISPTFFHGSLRDPSTTSSKPSPPSSSPLRYLKPGVFTSPVFHVKHQPLPGSQQGRDNTLQPLSPTPQLSDRVSRETTPGLHTHQTYVSRETSHPALQRPQQPTMFHVKRGETSSNTRETQPSPKTAKTRSTYPSK